MSNPLAQPRKPASALGMMLSRSAFRFPSAEDWVRGSLPRQKDAINPATAVRALSSRDVEVVSAVRVPEARFAPSESAAILMAKGKDVVYSSSTDGLSVSHKRYGAAAYAAVRFAELLPEQVEGRSLTYREEVREALLSGCMASGGPQYSLGRLEKYLPEKGRKGDLVVPTRGEVTEAMEGSFAGGYPPAGWTRSLDVRVNPRAELGFPFGGTADDPEALRKHARLQEQVRARLVEEGDVERSYQRMLADEPYLVLLKGKAKYDFYKWDKLADKHLRFYNVLPGWAKLELMTVTQPFEASVLPGLRSFQGMSLTQSGAEAVLEKLEGQLAKDFMAWLTCGDDTFVALRQPNGDLVLFALDCSSFDLTQHASVLRPIHEELRVYLRRFDAVTADLWKCFMQERLVTVSGSVVVRMKHGGPSGMPLQSKVNDLLMQVCLVRLRDRLRPYHERDRCLDEGDIERHVRRVGESLGLVVKLEQVNMNLEGEKTLRGVLEHRPFIFVGYNFWAEGGAVGVFADIPRMLKQLPYKTSQGWATRGDLDARMALKVAGVALSAGIPPAEIWPAFNDLLLTASSLLSGLPTDPSSKALQELLAGNAFVGLPQYLASRDALVAALTEEGVRRIWLEAGPIGGPTGGVVPERHRVLAGPLPARASQVVERVDESGAGRPPRIKRAELRKALTREARRAGGVMKLPKKQRERLLRMMQQDDGDSDLTDWSDDGMSERSEAESVQTDYSWSEWR